MAEILGEKAPYMVTILFAAAGWVVTHAVDQIEKSPTIEYTVRSEPGKVLVDLHNVTRDQSFKGLGFTLGTNGKGSWTKGYFAERSGPQWDGREPIPINGNTLAFTIDNFQPGWTFTLVGEYQDSPGTTFYLSNSADQVVHLTASDMETLFVNHELPILFSLLLIWFIITGLLLWRAQ